jgi:methyl-accepting chemotaxis protein
MIKRAKNGGPPRFRSSGPAGVVEMDLQENAASATDKTFFLDWLPIPVVAMDTNHTLIYINVAAAEIAGRRPEECIGKKFWEVLYDSPACHAETCAAGEAVRTGKVSTGEAHFKVRGNDWPVRVICSPRRDGDDRIVGCFQVMYEAHEEIRVSREIMRLVQAGRDGQLNERGRTEEFKGNYRVLIEGMNALLDALTTPLNLAAEYLGKLSKGVIPPKITQQYNGEFNTIKNSLNACIENLNALVADVDMLNKAASDGRLATRVDASKHEGDYRKIVEGFNQTLEAVVTRSRRHRRYWAKSPRRT